MKVLRLGSLLLILFAAAIFSCDKDNNNDFVGVDVALANYWDDQTAMTTAMEDREETMAEIQDAINSFNSKGDIEDIDALVNTYVSQCDAAAETFDKLSSLENSIVPYGEDKNIFSDIGYGIYNTGKNIVVSSGRMVRTSWRVLSGKKSLREALRDPESGIPIVSSAAERLQKHNADRDALIRQSILANDSQDGMIPLAELPGTTPQEKLNSYLNLDEENSLKMETRTNVMVWDQGERQRTANSAKAIAADGVRTLGDAISGGIPGEIVNNALEHNMNSGQDPDDKGTCNVTVNSDGAGNPPVTAPKTIIIRKVTAPADEPKITVIMNAPQALPLELPSGIYDFIVMADGYIRTIFDGISVTQGSVQNKMAELLTLAGNAIVIEDIIADPEVVTLSNTANVKLVCVSTIGKKLSFDWSVSGDYSNLVKNKNEVSFKPSGEGDYTVSCTVSDDLGNSETTSTVVTCLRGELVYVDYSISAETFSDSKVNPGETATLELEFTNEGIADMTGTVHINGLNGIQVGFTPVTSTIEVGDPVIWVLNFVCPTEFTTDMGEIEVVFDTQNQDNVPVQVRTVVEIPIDFYVSIDAITSPVEERVLNISGQVANPALTTAYLILDEDPDQTFQVNLNDGYFYQDVALTGDSDPVDHTAVLIATSGGLTELDNEDFTSDIPGTALRVTISWDTDGTDVDLWVTDPNGDKCYYMTDYTASGLELDFDDTDGYGPENITTAEVIPGDYLVQAHYYSDHDSENAIGTAVDAVIRQNEGANDETSNLYFGYLGDSGDVWTITTLTFDGKKWSQKKGGSHSFVDSSTLPPK